MTESEPFSNPLPPPDFDHSYEDESHPLTNADFRKLLMTPHASAATPQVTKKPIHTKKQVEPGAAEEGDEDDPSALRKKKKSYYAKLRKIEEERQKELEAKYRDRARERRDGVNKDYEEPEMISTTADYRAVAPDAKSGANYAERRKQVIQESKYLGGDMEHTHLVKGLDFALLEKVRAEITSKEKDDVEIEKAVVEKEKTEEEVKIEFKTKLGRNIFRQAFKLPPQRNELFLPRRMAYVADLEDDSEVSDIPTTLIRSKAECPTEETTATLTTNDMVINKLTQILSYLRQGARDKKKLKKLKKEEKIKEKLPGAEADIYDNQDFAPDYSSSRKDRRDDRESGKERSSRWNHDRDRDRRGDRDRRDRDRDRDRNRDRDRDRDRYDRDSRRDRDRDHDNKKRSYFEKPMDEDEERRLPQSAKDLVQSINNRYGGKSWNDVRNAPVEGDNKRSEADRMKRLKRKMQIDSYAECYPGQEEAADAIDDSDEEVDYTKMDMGNKKGPIGRWDFDTQEEYSDYMANKEALPKAAFQYGVKMADGRKTRRTGPKDEKQQLDREWQKIQNILQKRKDTGTGQRM